MIDVGLNEGLMNRGQV